MHKAIKHLTLFTDVSVNLGLSFGVGAYVIIPSSFLDASPGVIRKPEITAQIKVRRFEDTSSTRLELQTVLWALEDIRHEPLGSLTIYSDSQCVTGLLKRKNRLTATGFLSKKSGQELGNASLYRRFYELHNGLGFQVQKVEGHSKSSGHNAVQRIFSIVDKEARKALKLWLNELSEVRVETDNLHHCPIP